MFNSYEKDVVWVDYKEDGGILTLTVSPKSFFHRFCYRFSLKEYRFFRREDYQNSDYRGYWDAPKGSR